MENSNVENQKEDWLTVVEASQLSTEMGLTRTPKTIRRWASRSADLPSGVGDVVAERRDTAFGFEYVITRSSLVRKIEQELEFAKARDEDGERNSGVPTQGGTPEDMGTHVRTSDTPPGTPQTEQKPKGDVDLERENEKLRVELAETQIDATVHKKLNQQLVADRDTLIKQIENVTTLALQESKKVGQLEAEIQYLKALPAPSGDRADVISDEVGTVNEDEKPDDV